MCSNAIATHQAFVALSLAITFATSTAQGLSTCNSLHSAENCSTSDSLYKESLQLDTELNKIYLQSLSEYAPEQKQHLRTSQRVWLQFRKIECNAKHKAMPRGEALILTNNLAGLYE